MKYFIVLLLLLQTLSHFGQIGEVIHHQATLIKIEQRKDTIEFIVADTAIKDKKPVFLFCQGSLPIPLFCEIENYGYYMFGGGISNFNYKKIAKHYHLVVISMPKTPALAKKENLNSQYHFVPDQKKPDALSTEYIEADYLDNYVNRANSVLAFLKKQEWVDNNKLIVAGHSQGSKIATKIAVHNKKVTHLGLFSTNPFGRMDQLVRQARFDAQMGKINWKEADSLMDEQYEFYKDAHTMNPIHPDPALKAWRTFSETLYDDWLKLEIPIYIAYGTEDRSADLCDIIPLFFIEKHKKNLTLKRHIGLEHNFFETEKNGSINYEKSHWMDVMGEFMIWIQ